MGKGRSRPRSLRFCIAAAAAAASTPTPARGFLRSGPGASLSRKTQAQLLPPRPRQSFPRMSDSGGPSLGPAPASARPPGGARISAQLPAGTARPAANAPGPAARAAAEVAAAPRARISAQPSGGGHTPNVSGILHAGSRPRPCPLRRGPEGGTRDAGRGRPGGGAGV